MNRCVIHRFCFLFLLLVAFSASAQKTQKIDSLLTRLPQMKDAEKIEAFVQLSEYHINYDPAAGITYAQKALSLMKGNQWSLPKTRVLRHLGLCYKSQGNFTDALNHLYQSLLLSEQASLPQETVLTKRHLGRTYKQQRNRAKAESFFEDALDYYEKTNNDAQQSTILIDLGGLCADHGDLECAKTHYERALQIVNSGGSLARRSLVISNLASVYAAEGNYKKAIQFYEDAINLGKSNDNKREEMFIYGRIGFEYLNYLTDKEPIPAEYKLEGTRESHIAKSIENIEKAAEYFKQTDQVNEYQAFIRALPEAYFLAGEYEKGTEAFKAYYESKENTAEKQRASDLARAQLDYEFNRRKDSTQTAQQRKELQLQNEMKVREINFAHEKRRQADLAEKKQMEIRFAEAFKRKELESAHARNAERIRQENLRKLRTTWMVAGAIGVLLLIFYLIRTAQFARRKVAMEKAFSQNLVQTIEGERKRIAEELHDSVGQSLLVLKNKLHQDKSDTNTVDEIIGEVRGMSHNMHPYQFERLGLIRSMRGAVETLQQHSEIFFSFECEDESLGDAIAKENQIHIYRMVQESMNNVLKHSGAKACRVSVEDKGDSVLFEVKDNGKGFDPKSGGFESLGLKTMESRAKLTGSTFSIDSTPGKGTSVTIKVPKIPKPN